MVEVVWFDSQIVCGWLVVSFGRAGKLCEGSEWCGWLVTGKLWETGNKLTQLYTRECNLYLCCEDDGKNWYKVRRRSERNRRNDVESGAHRMWGRPPQFRGSDL